MPAPPVHIPDGERGFGFKPLRAPRSGAGAGRIRSRREGGRMPRVLGSGGARGPRTAPIAAHPHLGNTRFPGAHPALGPQPPARCPRRTGQRDLGGPGSARAEGAPRPGKSARTARVAHGRLLTGTARVLRPPPASPQGEAPQAAAASKQPAAELPPAPQPGTSGRGRDGRRLHSIIARRLQFSGGTGSKAVSPLTIGEERMKPTLPAASTHRPRACWEL